MVFGSGACHAMYSDVLDVLCAAVTRGLPEGSEMKRILSNGGQNFSPLPSPANVISGGRALSLTLSRSGQDAAMEREQSGAASSRLQHLSAKLVPAPDLTQIYQPESLGERGSA